ncbi:MAG: acyltransferase [Bacteroidota bacterium]|nr:acyltransferase [Bacteroidota bacterium]
MISIFRKLQILFSKISLQRITNTGKFIPEIDGLRFIAISLVVIYHIDYFIFRENLNQYNFAKENFSFLHSLCLRGHFGVQIFFIISAFIVSLPFCNYYHGNGNHPTIKDFLMRRLTRLEPPYIISLLLFYWIYVYLLDLKTHEELRSSFLASLFYSHGFVFDRYHHPLVNNVIWSLEIEIQFYLLAPFILAGIYKLGKWRYQGLIFLTFFISIISKFYKPEYYSLYEYFHFFTLGILLCDLYVIQKDKKWSTPTLIVEILTAAALIIGIWVTDITYMGKFNDPLKAALSSAQLVFLFLFFYLVLFRKFWKSFFTNPWITVIGGMCYTLYLFHNQIISGTGFYLIRKFYFSNYFIADYLAYSILMIFFILVASVIFFILIERPCMDRKWPQKLWWLIKEKLYLNGKTKI